MKFLSRAATVLSAIFSPLLMATYGVALAMVLSFLCFIPTATKLTVIFETLLATVAIPVIGIFVLYKVKVITDPKLNNRTDRTWPYIIATACFIGESAYLYMINAPTWLSLFLIGGAMALIVLTVVNRWWKISGHATGVGGLCAMIFYLMLSGNSIYNLEWCFLIAVLVAGAVCASHPRPAHPRSGGRRLSQRVCVRFHSRHHFPEHACGIIRCVIDYKHFLQYKP